jgi:hypothetical protein
MLNILNGRSMSPPETSVQHQFNLPAHELADFSNGIVTIPEFLSNTQMDELRREVDNLTVAERGFVPLHKKGGTIAYATLIEKAPAVTRLYHSEAMRSLVSGIFNEEVWPTPLHDQSSLSVLVYDRPGDHIDWHYDHNFYQGRHFTVLLSLVNHGRRHGGLSHARLFTKVGRTVTQIPTPPNTLVVFEGAKLLHKASPIEAGERRILISMTYCANSRASLAQCLARRLKDMAFFGVRALWT